MSSGSLPQSRPAPGPEVRAGYVLPTVRPVGDPLRRRPGGSGRPAGVGRPAGDAPAGPSQSPGPVPEDGLGPTAAGAVLLGPAATTRVGAALLAMLLQEGSARAGVLALWGQAAPAPGSGPPGPPGLPAARALAGRLADAGIPGTASGRIVRVTLRPDAEPALLDLALLDGLVDAAARVLVVPGARPDALSGVLADAALVVVALRPASTEPVLEALARAELAAAAPRARVRVLALGRAVLGPSPRRLRALLEAG